MEDKITFTVTKADVEAALAYRDKVRTQFCPVSMAVKRELNVGGVSSWNRGVDIIYDTLSVTYKGSAEKLKRIVDKYDKGVGKYFTGDRTSPPSLESIGFHDFKPVTLTLTREKNAKD